MQTNLIYVAVLIAVALAFGAAVMFATPASIKWDEALESDRAALRATLDVNHPINPLAPAKASNVGEEASTTVTPQRYAYELIAAATAFHDPHISVEPITPLPTPRWPGFLIARRGGLVLVVSRAEKDPMLPPLGAILDRCDGAGLEALMASRVLPYGLDQRVVANRYRAVAEALIDRGNPLAPPPSSCTFTVGGETKAYKLAYVDVPADFPARYEAALFGRPALLKWSEPAPGVVWIGIPSFDYDEPNASRLRPLIDRLGSDAARLRDGRAIVFDVRGNTGGSSLWADEIRNILWYPEQIAKWGPPDPSGVDWRASAGNRDYMLALIDKVIPKVGSQSDTGLALTRIARGLSEAAAQKKTYWREGNASPGAGGGLTKRRPTAEKPLFKAKVIILSNGSCASACLDFADRILQMPGTYLVGFPTAGDGLTTESRAVTLPSGHAILHFPMKIYRGRPRGDMEYYEPDAAFDGSWTDENVRAWLLGLIEQGKP